MPVRRRSSVRTPPPEAEPVDEEEFLETQREEPATQLPDDEVEEDESPQQKAKEIAEEDVPQQPAARQESDDEEDAIELEAEKIRYKTLFDVIDFYQELVFRQKDKREQHYRAMLQFYEQHKGKDKEYGRLYVRLLMGQIILDVMNMDSVAQDCWTRDTWQTLSEQLANLKDLCLRKDCTAADDEDKNPEIDEERAQLKLFTKPYENIRRAIVLHYLLQPIRHDLEEQIAQGKTGTPAVDAAVVLGILYVSRGCKHTLPFLTHHSNMARDLDDATARECMAQLFREKDDDEEVDGTDEVFGKRQEIIVDLEDLKKLLNQNPFKLEWAKNKIEKLIVRWNASCFGDRTPILYQINYHDPATPGKSPIKQRLPRQTSPNRKQVEGLRKRRADLRNNHGSDPIEESRAVAAEVVRETKKARGEEVDLFQAPSRRHLHNEAQSAAGPDHAVAMDKDDDDEEESIEAEKESAAKKNFFDDTDDDDENRKPAALSGTPVAAAAASSFYIGPDPDPGVFDESGNVAAKRPWTEEETDALIEGLRVFGLGKWVQIKNFKGEALRNRNSIQVKDKFRNMKKMGRLPPDCLIKK